MRRSRRPLLIVAYVVRVLLFFSAGTLLAFRKAAAEEEKICDDWAVAVTGRPDALAAVLEKLRHSDAYEVDDGEAGEDLAIRGEHTPGHDRSRLERHLDPLQVLALGTSSASILASWKPEAEALSEIVPGTTPSKPKRPVSSVAAPSRRIMRKTLPPIPPV